MNPVRDAHSKPARPARKTRQEKSVVRAWGMISCQAMLISGKPDRPGGLDVPLIARRRSNSHGRRAGLGSFPGDPSVRGRAARRRRGEARSGLHPPDGARPDHGNGAAKARG